MNLEIKNNQKENIGIITENNGNMGNMGIYVLSEKICKGRYQQKQKIDT